jgi:drug/metabolite transporter (DMT)-like permease
MEDNRVKWMAITAIAPIAWGSTYVVTRHLLPPESPLWGGVLRALPAGLIVLWMARALPQGSWWWRSLVLGTLNVGGFFVLVYVAGQRLPSSLAATLMSASAACMLLFAWLLLHRRPRAAAVAGAGIGLVGVVVMLGVDLSGVDPWGVAASLGAMVASSIGFVLTARWGSDVPALRMTAWQLVAGSLVLLPAALLVEGAPPALTVGSALGFAYVTLVATALAYAAWFAGLRHLSPGVVGVIGLLNPVTGVALGVLVAGEAFGVPQALGVALVLAGIALGALPPQGAGSWERRGGREMRTNREMRTDARHPSSSR